MRTMAIRTVCSGLCLLAGVTLAQVPYTAPGLPPARANTNANVNVVTDRELDRQENETQKFNHVKDLLGSNVKNAQGEELGEIDDILISPHSGEVFATIGVDNDRIALVPVQALKVTKPAGLLRDAEVTLQMSKQGFLSGPTIGDKEWGNLENPGFTRKVYSHYKVDSPAAMGSAESIGDHSVGSDSSKDRLEKQPRDK